jgi:hypothetical protein
MQHLKIKRRRQLLQEWISHICGMRKALQLLVSDADSVPGFRPLMICSGDVSLQQGGQLAQLAGCGVF